MTLVTTIATLYQHLPHTALHDITIKVHILKHAEAQSILSVIGWSVSQSYRYVIDSPGCCVCCPHTVISIAAIDIKVTKMRSREKEG
jgi:hypothetical protein